MSNSPFVYALVAAAYIVGLVFVINTITSLPTIQQTLLIPMVMLSLFVLSAAVMGFLFLYEPLKFYFDGKQSEAVQFFLKTVGIFACFSALFVGALFYVLS